MIYAFLLIGQSNAAGRGNIANAPRLNNCNGRMKILRNGLWRPMFRPINPDRASSGISFGESFARCFADAYPGAEVGIIPCADGGSALSQWMPGEVFYDYALACARLGMRSAKLAGILWHQGESDCAPELCGTYCQRLQTMMTQLRQDLGMPELPILVGGLGEYLIGCERFPEVQNYRELNGQLQKFAAEDSKCEFVDASGLEGKADNLHFTAAAQLEFGKRYFEAYQKLGIPLAGDEVAAQGAAEGSGMDQL
ncbi:MAG: sialate O-acetylesterase [Ruminococcaceae bacterium]|nr:sialate O-acetylesterase [Oscillospiraceae bacterium]